MYIHYMYSKYMIGGRQDILMLFGPDRLTASYMYTCPGNKLQLQHVCTIMYLPPTHVACYILCSK